MCVWQGGGVGRAAVCGGGDGGGGLGWEGWSLEGGREVSSS